MYAAFAARTALDEDVWIGLSDQAVEGAFEWVDGSPLGYSSWEVGEPNDSMGEDCGEIFADELDWNDDPCGELQASVCELPNTPMTGTCLAPRALSLGAAQNGDTNTGTALPEYVGCVSFGEMWQVVPATSGVLRVDVDSPLDMVLSARESRCILDGFEVAACVDFAGGGTTETLEVPVEAGVPMTLIVSPYDGDDFGPYSITADIRPSQCGDGFVTAGVEDCDDSGTAAGDGCSTTCGFELVVAEVEPNNSLLQPQVIAVDAPLIAVMSALSAGEADFYRLTNATAAPLAVRVEAWAGEVGRCFEGSEARDPELEVFDAAGAAIDDAYDNSPAGWCFFTEQTIPANSEIYLRVFGYSGWPVSDLILLVMPI